VTGARWAAVLAVVPACWPPHYDHPLCPTGNCPPDYHCNNQTMECELGSIDAAVVDMAGAPSDTSPVCYGSGEIWQVCLDAAPTGSMTLPSKLDTDGGDPCQPSPRPGWHGLQPEACFITAEYINVNTDTFVTGSRPLVLLAARMIAITSVLDFASHQRDNTDGTVRSPAGDCTPFGRSPVSGGGDGAGGGAGGSSRTKAGDGGPGGNGAHGGFAGEEVTSLALLRGGCRGQRGADLAAGDAGRGGGAVYLLAGVEIGLSSAINASGAGGSGGSLKAGGNGGGSGGTIVLYAPQITTAGQAAVIANGGGGGGGGGQFSVGVSGADPAVTMPSMAAPGGGNGGSGYAVGTEALAGRMAGAAMMGGGGGGGGGGYIQANKMLGVMVAVSPPATIVP
jgi:hypothetical protein